MSERTYTIANRTTDKRGNLKADLLEDGIKVTNAALRAIAAALSTPAKTGGEVDSFVAIENAVRALPRGFVFADAVEHAAPERVPTPQQEALAEPIAWLRDLDGTGSLHTAAKGDPGAFPVVPAPGGRKP